MPQATCILCFFALSRTLLYHKNCLKLCASVRWVANQRVHIWLQAGELPDDVDWAFVFRVDPNGTVSRVYSTIPDKRFVELTEGSPSNIGMTKGISPISQVSDHLHPINVSRNFCAKNLNYIKNMAFWWKISKFPIWILVLKTKFKETKMLKIFEFSRRQSSILPQKYKNSKSIDERKIEVHPSVYL